MAPKKPAGQPGNITLGDGRTYNPVTQQYGTTWTTSGPMSSSAPPAAPATPGAATPPPAAGPSAEDLYWQQMADYAAQDRANQQNQLIEVTKRFFKETGMEAFIAGMEKYVRAGYTGDSLMVMLANDKDYQEAWAKRFAGNAIRKANGLSELLPASYVAMEQGYKQLYQRYGVPATLFDDPSDFADLIGKDVAVTEVNDRLSMASQYVNYSGNAAVRQQLRDLYDMTDGEMMAYVLDPKRTEDYLQSESRRNFNRANVGGAAATAGVTLAADFRDEIAGLYTSIDSSYTSTYGDASGKFAAVARDTPGYQRLGALSGVAASADELIREQFDMAGGGAVANKKLGLASAERARFSGQSAVGSTSLSAGRRAQ